MASPNGDAARLTHRAADVHTLAALSPALGRAVNGFLTSSTEGRDLHDTLVACIAEVTRVASRAAASGCSEADDVLDKLLAIPMTAHIWQLCPRLPGQTMPSGSAFVGRTLQLCQVLSPTDGSTAAYLLLHALCDSPRCARHLVQLPAVHAMIASHINAWLHPVAAPDAVVVHSRAMSASLLLAALPHTPAPEPACFLGQHVQTAVAALHPCLRAPWALVGGEPTIVLEATEALAALAHLTELFPGAATRCGAGAAVLQHLMYVRAGLHHALRILAAELLHAAAAEDGGAQLGALLQRLVGHHLGAAEDTAWESLCEADKSRTAPALLVLSRWLWPPAGAAGLPRSLASAGVRVAWAVTSAQGSLGDDELLDSLPAYLLHCAPQQTFQLLQLAFLDAAHRAVTSPEAPEKTVASHASVDVAAVEDQSHLALWLQTHCRRRWQGVVQHLVPVGNCRSDSPAEAFVAGSVSAALTGNASTAGSSCSPRPCAHPRCPVAELAAATSQECPSCQAVYHDAACMAADRCGGHARCTILAPLSAQLLLQPQPLGPRALKAALGVLCQLLRSPSNPHISGTVVLVSDLLRCCKREKVALPEEVCVSVAAFWKRAAATAGPLSDDLSLLALHAHNCSSDDMLRTSVASDVQLAACLVQLGINRLDARCGARAARFNAANISMDRLAEASLNPGASPSSSAFLRAAAAAVSEDGWAALAQCPELPLVEALVLAADVALHPTIARHLAQPHVMRGLAMLLSDRHGTYNAALCGPLMQPVCSAHVLLTIGRHSSGECPPPLSAAVEQLHAALVALSSNAAAWALQSEGGRGASPQQACPSSEMLPAADVSQVVDGLLNDSAAWWHRTSPGGRSSHLSRPTDRALTPAAKTFAQIISVLQKRIQRTPPAASTTGVPASVAKPRSLAKPDKKKKEEEARDLDLLVAQLEGGGVGRTPSAGATLSTPSSSSSTTTIRRKKAGKGKGAAGATAAARATAAGAASATAAVSAEDPAGATHSLRAPATSASPAALPSATSPKTLQAALCSACGPPLVPSCTTFRGASVVAAEGTAGQQPSARQRDRSASSCGGAPQASGPAAQAGMSAAASPTASPHSLPQAAAQGCAATLQSAVSAAHGLRAAALSTAVSANVSVAGPVAVLAAAEEVRSSDDTDRGADEVEDLLALLLTTGASPSPAATQTVVPGSLSNAANTTAVLEHSLCVGAELPAQAAASAASTEQATQPTATAQTDSAAAFSTAGASQLPCAPASSRARVVGSEPPTHLCCPITLSLLVDPVLAADGEVYSRAAMEAWLTRSSMSPMTGEVLPHTMLTPCRLVHSLVREWCEEHGMAPP